MHYNPCADDPQNHESMSYCKAHHREYWPSEGCSSCRHERWERNAVHGIVDALIDIGSGLDRTRWSDKNE